MVIAYQEFWEKYEDFLKNSNDSPLEEEQKQTFKSVPRFEEDKKYRVKVVLKERRLQPRIQVMGPEGKVITVIKKGIVEFTINSFPHQKLTVYYDPEKQLYFIHFKDLTNGKETYGAGRFVNLYPIGENEFILDFNLAYNPYCVYNDNWTCPTPPLENRLTIPIQAGEKDYHLSNE